MSLICLRVRYVNLVCTSLAGMAELADAADSKSAEVHPSWGFNSPSRHQFAPVGFVCIGVLLLRQSSGSGFRLRARTPAKRLKFNSPSRHQFAPVGFVCIGVLLLRQSSGSGLRLRARTPSMRLKS